MRDTNNEYRKKAAHDRRTDKRQGDLYMSNHDESVTCACPAQAHTWVGGCVSLRVIVGASRLASTSLKINQDLSPSNAKEIRHTIGTETKISALLIYTNDKTDTMSNVLYQIDSEW